MISPLHVYCWAGYLIWLGAAGLCLADYNPTLFQVLLVFWAGILGVWLVLSRLVRGTSLDEDFELEDDLKIPQ